jgi:FtsH-binding integral membrane protein
VNALTGSSCRIAVVVRVGKSPYRRMVDTANIMSEIYLGLAAALIFSACFIAAKKNRLALKRKQVLMIALLAVITVLLIWKLVGIWSKKSEREPENFPSYSPAETAVSIKSGVFAGTSTGAGSIETILNSVEPSSRLSTTVSPALRPSSA